MRDIEKKIEELLSSHMYEAGQDNIPTLDWSVITPLMNLIESEKRKAFEAGRETKISKWMNDYKYPTYESYVSSSPSEKIK